MNNRYICSDVTFDDVIRLPFKTYLDCLCAHSWSSWLDDIDLYTSPAWYGFKKNYIL